MTVPRRILAVAVAAGMVLALALLSALGWRAHPEGAAEVRVSWRTVAPNVESCRPPTEEEVQGVPAHMRPREICSGDAIAFRLRVALDDRVVHDAHADPPSGRGDRTISIFESFPIPAGEHRIDVSFWPDSSAAELPEGLERRLATGLRVESGDVVLVSMGEGGELTIRRSP